MLYDYGKVDATKRVLIHGTAGNVGTYAVQIAKRAGATVLAPAHTQGCRDVDFVRTLGADEVIDVKTVCGDRI